MNKPFYGVATMPHSERCISLLTQPILLIMLQSPVLALMTIINKRTEMIFPNGGIKLII